MTDELPKHDDPAVQALINGGWLGEWDYPITVDDLVYAVRLVREASAELSDKTDRRAAEYRQENGALVLADTARGGDDRKEGAPAAGVDLMAALKASLEQAKKARGEAS